MSAPSHILQSKFTHLARSIRKDESLQDYQRSGAVHELYPMCDTFICATPTGAYRFRTSRGTVYEVAPDGKWAKITN